MSNYLESNQLSQESVAEKPRLYEGDPLAVFNPLSDYRAEIIRHDDIRIIDALKLEINTMRLLGDPTVKADIEESYSDSGFIVVYEKEVLAGAVRYILPCTTGSNKTFRDVAQSTGKDVAYVEDLFVQQSGNYGYFVTKRAIGAESTIDASSLSPDLSNIKLVKRRTDALLATCRIVGQTLFEAGIRTHTTGNLHELFLKHGKKIGYPFTELVDKNGEVVTSFIGRAANFYPVHSSLEHYSKLMNEASNPHLAAVRDQYNKISNAEKNNIALAMVKAIFKTSSNN